MGTYGLTANGWVGKDRETVDAEVDAGMQKILGPSAATVGGKIDPNSNAGKLKAMLVDRIMEHWNNLQALASSVDPEQATDKAQDVVCAITGTVRDAASFSTVTGTCTGDPNTVLAVGRVATVQTSGSRFDSQPSGSADPNTPASTIVALPAWAVSTPYVLGQRVTANGNAYQCVVAGTSAGSGTGPSGTTLGAAIVDNGATWNFLGSGTGAVDVTFTAEVAGPLGAVSNQLNQIGSPQGGWKGVTNMANAVPGRLLETDSALRVRRDSELELTGNTTVDAIRAQVLAVNQGSIDPAHQAPTAVTVLYNDTDAVDANGLPPHSVEVVVTGGTDADIALAVWNSTGAGTATGGNQTTIVTDAEGNPQTVKWTRPTAVPIYVVATVFYDPAKWPATGAAALVVQAALSALLTFGEQYAAGQSVRAMPLGAAILDGPSALNEDGSAFFPAPAGSAAAPGLLDVSPLYIGTSPSPSGSGQITIGVRSFAQFSSANVSLTAIAEAP